MIKVGTYLKVKTKTHRDVFGTVFYKIIETDIECRLDAKDVKDGVKLEMIGGEGKSAYPGRIIYDRMGALENLLNTEQASFISKLEAEKISTSHTTKKITGFGPGGIQEID